MNGAPDPVPAHPAGDPRAAATPNDREGRPTPC